MVARRLREDSHFPPQDEELREVAKFALLWATKDLDRVREANVFWILVEMDLRSVINQRSRLSPTLFKQL